MIGYRSYVVLTLIRQSAGSREYFHNTDHTEEEKHHPDDLVALEEITYSIIHLFLVFLEILNHLEISC